MHQIDSLYNPTDAEFFAGPFARLEGWCDVEAAAITLYLQRFQRKLGWTASNYEIGVFKGKYLSVLERAATEAGHRTTGIDIFTVEPYSLVVAGLARELGPRPKLTLIQKDSSTYTSEELAAAVDAPASWVSVDGDHSAQGVMNDLRNAEATLAPWGIVAIDDYLNWQALGVVEGATRHLACGKSRLRPFCLVANKLLVAFEEYVGLYHQQVPKFCAQYPDFPKTKMFLGEHAAGRQSWHTQTLIGCPVWLIT